MSNVLLVIAFILAVISFVQVIFLSKENARLRKDLIAVRKILDDRDDQLQREINTLTLFVSKIQEQTEAKVEFSTKEKGYLRETARRSQPKKKTRPSLEESRASSRSYAKYEDAFPHYVTYEEPRKTTKELFEEKEIEVSSPPVRESSYSPSYSSPSYDDSSSSDSSSSGSSSSYSGGSDSGGGGSFD